MHVSVDAAAVLLAAVSILQLAREWLQSRRRKATGDVVSLNEGWSSFTSELQDERRELREQVDELRRHVEIQHGELLQLRSVVAQLREELDRAEREIDRLHERRAL